MGSSNDKINYNLRPSKSIERKMILDVLKEICSPRKAENYQYIGMGSAFFVDFKLFHKILGINQMFSFEGKKSNIERCDKNKPFGCIKVIPERTEKGLSEIDWKTNKSIVWLDYESEINTAMLGDVNTIVQNAQSGNILITTLRRSNDQYENKIEQFQNEFKNYLLKKVTYDDLHIRNSAKLLNNIFNASINDKVTKVFSAYKEHQKLNFYPLFEFTYEDGAAMYTFGGIFLNSEDKEEFDTFKLHELDFVRKENRPYSISFPIITDQEFHLLNSKLPAPDLATFTAYSELETIPKLHRENYFRTYKYYPNYSELLI